MVENESKTASGKSLPKVPSREDVHQWIKRDISASSYFLSMLLRYPDIIESMAGELYAKVLERENGAAVDHVDEKQTEMFDKSDGIH